MKRTYYFAFIIAVLVITAQAQRPQQIERELVRHIDALEKVSNYGGSSDEDGQTRENTAIRSALLKYGSRSAVLAYSFPELSKKLFLTTSRDGKLRTYSWDMEEGGTMHNYCTVYQYRGTRGKVNAWAAPYSESVEDRGVGTFVHQIFQTETGTGTIYLAVSTFIGSTSLAGQTITAFKIDGERLDRNVKVIRTASGLKNSIRFSYDFFSVVDHPERPIKLFYFNESKKSFRFPIVIEDKKTPQGRVTDKFITYRFDGKQFVKVS